MIPKMTLRRRAMLTALVLLGLAPRSWAQDDPAIVAPVQQLVGALLAVMKAGSAGQTFDQRYAALAPVIDQTFDLDAILRESVGASWDSLPADQRAALVDAFRRYTVASYVHSFDEFSGQRFVISPDTRAVGSEQVVETKIIPADGSGHELDYVMRQNGSDWRVVDVLAEGSISRVAVQRSDFRRLLARGGAQALASSLRAKSADLSG